MYASGTKTDGTSSAIAYGLNAKRFGDKLISYCHAKWISYKHNIPLLYRPFTRSDKLILHTKYALYDESKFDQIVKFRSRGQKQNDLPI